MVVRSKGERTLRILLVQSKKLRGVFPWTKGGLEGGFERRNQPHPGAARPREVFSRLHLRATPPNEGIFRRGIRIHNEQSMCSRPGISARIWLEDNMGSIGAPELIIIFVVALIVFGPKKLPELGKSLGKGLAEFRKASSELKSTIEQEVQDVESGPSAMIHGEAESRVKDSRGTTHSD